MSIAIDRVSDNNFNRLLILALLFPGLLVAPAMWAAESSTHQQHAALPIRARTEAKADTKHGDPGMVLVGQQLLREFVLQLRKEITTTRVILLHRMLESEHVRQAIEPVNPNEPLPADKQAELNQREVAIETLRAEREVLLSLYEQCRQELECFTSIEPWKHGRGQRVLVTAAFNKLRSALEPLEHASQNPGRESQFPRTALR